MAGASWFERNEKGQRIDYEKKVIPENFFQIIDGIATLIGMALESSPEFWYYNKYLRKRVSRVTQTKEKYGTARVYVSMPDTKEAQDHYWYVYKLIKNSFPKYWKYVLDGADYSEIILRPECKCSEFSELMYWREHICDKNIVIGNVYKCNKCGAIKKVLYENK